MPDLDEMEVSEGVCVGGGGAGEEWQGAFGTMSEEEALGHRLLSLGSPSSHGKDTHGLPQTEEPLGQGPNVRLLWSPC